MYRYIPGLCRGVCLCCVAVYVWTVSLYYMWTVWPEIEPMERDMCPLPECDAACVSGVKFDAFGCETCECQDASVDCSAEPSCYMHCPYGFNKVLSFVIQNDPTPPC